MINFQGGGWGVVKNLLKIVESLVYKKNGAGAGKKQTGSATLYLIHQEELNAFWEIQLLEHL